MTEIAPGRRVVMHFSLTLEDGTVAEDTFDQAPLEFTVGDGSMTAGLEYALYGMRPGEEQTVTLTPPQTFGRHDPQKIHTLPLSAFKTAPRVGQIIAFTGDGAELPGAVKKVGGKSVTVDFNHPLAGHDLVYRAKILAVR